MFTVHFVLLCGYTPGMDMKSAQNESQIDQRIRTMRTLWSAMFLSIGGYYVFTLFAERPAINPNSTLSLTLVVIGLLMIPVAKVIKNKLLTQAVDQQRPQLVQQGYIITWLITEMAALLGLFDFYLTGNRYYFALFIIAACGQLLHFPQRRHVVDASFKNPTLDRTTKLSI
jgi:hypothetical protein